MLSTANTLPYCNLKDTNSILQRELFCRYIVTVLDFEIFTNRATHSGSKTQYTSFSYLDSRWISWLHFENYYTKIHVLHSFIDIILHCNNFSLYTFFMHINSFPAGGDFCRLLITFADILAPDQVRQNVGTDLDPNCLTFWLYSRKNFLKKLIKKKSTDDKNAYTWKIFRHL